MRASFVKAVLDNVGLSANLLKIFIQHHGPCRERYTVDRMMIEIEALLLYSYNFRSALMKILLQ